MKYLLYERKLPKHTIVAGLCMTNMHYWFDSLAYIIEWLLILFMFYFNATYVNSRMLSLFIFIIGIVLLFGGRTQKRLVIKEEFEKELLNILNKEEQEN